jgi:hypothetical protein
MLGVAPGAFNVAEASRTGGDLNDHPLDFEDPRAAKRARLLEYNEVQFAPNFNERFAWR